ncbi:MAG: putative DNA binding domain-containing protein [Oscillospiraceae bacterium]|nr:putative DNA binding domain-containing protein [Oscillospiraceae bacterium]
MPFQKNMINSIIEEARKYLYEQPWIEFKHNNHDPQEIGEYLSALSNTAALFNQEHAFLIWGIDDETHDIVGTSFIPQETKVGNQGLELWISTQLEPQIQFYFHTTEIEGKPLVLLEIARAHSAPVKFKGVDYIRIDSYKKKLKDFPDTERELWAIFSKKPFEAMIAMENVSGDFVLRELDYSSYFDLLSQDLLSDKAKILEALVDDKMIVKAETGNYNITNLGAILFAKRLSDFPSLARKAVRVIKYEGTGRIGAASKEQVGGKGYACGFEGLITYITNLLPNNEIMGKALRKVVPMYPDIAVRELVANCLIHQNFFMQGTSPLIEIFSDRMEITNPGSPLIDKARFVDHPPVSRNEQLASFMRRIGVCEERGSGYDKVVFETEFYQLPAPEIEIYNDHTKVILFAHKEYAQMSKEDRYRACYLHACLKRVNRDYMTNASLRERFNIDKKNSSMVSRLLSETCALGLVYVSPDSTSDKNRKYLPFWA